MLLLPSGDFIDPSAVESVTTGEWSKDGPFTLGHRVVINFKSGVALEYPATNHEEAIVLRDLLGQLIVASLAGLKLSGYIPRALRHRKQSS